GAELDLGDGPFEFTDIGVDDGRDVVGDVVGDVPAPHAGLGAEDGDAGFELGRGDLGDHSLLEAGDEAVGQVGDFVGRGVGREDDLAGGLVEAVEGVVELFLGAFAPADEVDVVDDQDVDVAEL